MTSNKNHINTLITENIDTWTSAIKHKSATGRGSNKKHQLYGIKKLREMILELAMRGKLAPQDHNDEPASVLLERIAEEKAQLVKDKKIKKAKVLPKIRKEDKAFHLPHGWSWCYLSDISTFINGYAFKSSTFEDTGVGVVKIGDISASGYLTSKTMSRVSDSVVKDLDKNLQVAYGELVIAMSGATTGKLGFNNTNQIFYLNQRVGKIIPYQVDLKYLYFALTTKIAENLAKLLGSAIPNLSITQINEIVLALPPIQEQQRIVAKVDELMLLSDELEQRTGSRIAAHKILVKVLLNTLTESQNASELQTNWARVSDFFDTLFTTDPCGEWAIEQLKQTILQLAVIGKLVPQDSNDEPAAKLLERIAIEKAHLIAKQKIKKPKALPPISDKEKSFELPQGWEWCRLGVLINLISGQHLKPNEYSDSNIYGGAPYITGPAEFGDTYPNYSKYTIEKRSLAHKDDILITCKGTGLGKLNRGDQTIAISRQLMAIQPISVNIDYIYYLVDSRYQYFQNKGIGIAIPGISREDVTGLLLLLPPKEEQHRIVAKVDSLMAICAQLKSKLNQAQQTQLNLTDAIVSKAI